MKTEHAVDIELCKKLTSIGFPETELYWDSHAIDKIDGYGITSDGEYVCPSVMELLQSLRTDRRNIALRRYTEQECSPIMGKIPKSLPDFLAEFVIWDYEHK